MKRIKGLILPIVIVIIWFIVSKLHMFNEYILPSPQKIFITAVGLIKSGELIRNLLVSLIRVILGFTITFLFSFPLAVFIGLRPKVMPYIEPFIEFMRHVPPIATIPMLILWFGIGEVSKFFVIFLATFFQFSLTL